MGLRAQVAADAKAILENSISGFGWPLVLTSPAGETYSLVGESTDVSESIDPETGQAVTGRRASVTVSMLSLPELPAVVHESTGRPWLVTVADAKLVAATWKVADVRPDRVLGIVVLILEGYERG